MRDRVVAIKTGYVACDYTQGEELGSVRHGHIRATDAEAAQDAAMGKYEGVRYAHIDGYLYVDEPEDAND